MNDESDPTSGPPGQPTPVPPTDPPADPATRPTDPTADQPPEPAETARRRFAGRVLRRVSRRGRGVVAAVVVGLVAFSGLAGFALGTPSQATGWTGSDSRAAGTRPESPQDPSPQCSDRVTTAGSALPVRLLGAGVATKDSRAPRWLHAPARR